MDGIVTGALDAFFGKFTHLTYRKGDIILRAEDAPQGVMYLTKGYVRQYMVDEWGTMLMFHIFKPNSFFPVTWVVNDEPNRYYLKAVTPVELWRAPKKAVREFLHNNPPVVYDLTRLLLSGLCGIGIVSNTSYQALHIKRRFFYCCIWLIISEKKKE